MRPFILPLLLSVNLGIAGHTPLHAQGKRIHFVSPKYKPLDGQVSVGLMGGTLNYQGSIASGFSFLFMADFLKTTNSSLSWGTDLKLGLDNKNGLGIPMSIANVAVAYLSNGNAASDEGNRNDTGYYEFPLLLRYNYGFGSTFETDKKVGFYVGGGMTYIITGYLANTGYAESISFFGTVLEAGIRVQHLQIGLSKVFSLRQPLGPITNNPCMYEMTISCLIKKND